MAGLVPRVSGSIFMDRVHENRTGQDRKSTRLNSSHLVISYAVFCLKKTIHATVAARIYDDVHAAAAAMGKVPRDVYTFDPERADAYDALYPRYNRLHDHFGRTRDGT